MKHYKTQTTYFLSEGKANLPECLRLSLRHAKACGINSVIIFTTNGEGLELACTKYLGQEEFKGIQLIGVSWPIGKVPDQALNVPEDRLQLLQKHEINLIRAAFPFEELPGATNAPKGRTQTTIEIFGGGMYLCLNAVVVACDAGMVLPGEHVISMSADTSILVKASPSARAMSTLAVREIICKPIVQDITKGETLAAEVNAEALLARRKGRKVLPSNSQTEIVHKKES